MSLSQPCRVTACRSGSFLYWEEGDTWWAKTTRARFPWLSKSAAVMVGCPKTKCSSPGKGHKRTTQACAQANNVASLSHVSRYFCHIREAAPPALPTQVRNVAVKAEQRFEPLFLTWSAGKWSQNLKHLPAHNTVQLAGSAHARAHTFSTSTTTCVLLHTCFALRRSQNGSD